MAKTSTLVKRDAEAEAGKVIRKASKLLNRDSVILTGGRRPMYQRLIQENEPLFTVDLVKDMLNQAYRCTSETDMIDQICEIIETCWETEDPLILLGIVSAFQSTRPVRGETATDSRACFR